MLIPLSSAAYQKHAQSESLFDTHPETRLNFSHVQQKLSHGYTEPFLLVDSQIIRQKVRRFKTALPNVKPHYAVKANPDRRILRTLIEEQTKFEIASIAELDSLLELNVPAAEIFYSNPVKSRAYLKYAAEKGVEWYVLDSLEELKKIISIKPDAKLCLRIDTPNIGSDWPLAGKFGAYPTDTTHIIQAAANYKTDLAGVAFHAGSQCRNPQNWRTGIDRAIKIFAEMQSAGLKPRLLNIGGGYPVRHQKPIPSIEIIADVINTAIADLPEAIQIIAEPGRYLVSDAAYFVCQVIGTASRNGKRWMYWDAGLFGGMIEVTEGLNYEILTDRTGDHVPWTIAGPTCDSVDVLMRDVMLPVDIKEGDMIYIPNAGAYTTAYASNFNGFPLPDVDVI